MVSALGPEGMLIGAGIGSLIGVASYFWSSNGFVLIH
jgi:hypothetical protein